MQAQQSHIILTCDLLKVNGIVNMKYHLNPCGISTAERDIPTQCTVWPGLFVGTGHEKDRFFKAIKIDDGIKRVGKRRFKGIVRLERGTPAPGMVIYYLNTSNGHLYLVNMIDVVSSEV